MQYMLTEIEYQALKCDENCAGVLRAAVRNAHRILTEMSPSDARDKAVRQIIEDALEY